MRKIFATFALAFALLASPTLAHEFKLGELEIIHPNSRAMVPGAPVGGGYLRIINHGKTEDRLISAKSDRAGIVQLHEMAIENDVMKMREVSGGIVIPAGTTVELKPGGLHVMFMKIDRPFKNGEMIKTTLTFEKAGSVDVEFQVGAASGGASDMKHDDHAHASHGGHASPAEVKPSGDPMRDIPVKMKSIFETADKPLVVEPVVVQGQWAVAGWTQDGKGGRALLKDKGDGWSIHLCSGDGLKNADALKTMGLSDSDAQALAKKLADAEAHIDPRTLALFASFEGTVMVEGGDAKAHGGHDTHDQHRVHGKQ